MKALSLIDCLFLLLENQKQPMHIAGLCLFELPDDADTNFVANLAQEFRSHRQVNFPFNHKLSSYLHWEHDHNFRLEHHFYHMTLSDGTLDELLHYISAQHEKIIKKDKPLWELHLIGNICPANKHLPPRFAIWLKVHHSLTDGVAGMRLLQRSLSQTPDALESIPFWATTKKSTKSTKTHQHRQKPTFTAWSKIIDIRPVAMELWSGFQAKFKQSSPFVSTFDAPKSILNQKISHKRHLSMASFHKNRFTSTAKALSVSTNDLILAVCAGALRRYLISQNALPDKPLIAFVPISLRRDDSATGNQLSFLLANLGTHLDHAKERLFVIKDSMDDGKRRFSRLNFAQVIAYSLCVYGWAGINLATGLSPTRQAFNLIISNVPAESSSLYLYGAKLTGIYPASVLFDGQAMNITFVNHQDTIDFGITACSSALPNIEQFLVWVADELAVFESLANTSTSSISEP